MRIRVKICGLTDEAGTDAAVNAGADAVGFVFADSVRRVALARAAELVSRVPPFVTTVAVFRHPEPDLVRRVMQQVRPDVVQTDVEDLDALAEVLPRRVLPVYREGGREVPPPRDRDNAPETILFEGPRSGAGVPADWRQAARLSATTRLVLAGGLHAGNVALAIARVRPHAVDVSSGVESSPGHKDPTLIRTFVETVAAASLRASPPGDRP